MIGIHDGHLNLACFLHSHALVSFMLASNILQIKGDIKKKK